MIYSFIIVAAQSVEPQSALGGQHGIRMTDW